MQSCNYMTFWHAIFSGKVTGIHRVNLICIYPFVVRKYQYHSVPSEG